MTGELRETASTETGIDFYGFVLWGPIGFFVGVITLAALNHSQRTNRSTGSLASIRGCPQKMPQFLCEKPWICGACWSLWPVMLLTCFNYSDHQFLESHCFQQLSWQQNTHDSTIFIHDCPTPSLMVREGNELSNRDILIKKGLLGMSNKCSNWLSNIFVNE